MSAPAGDRTVLQATGLARLIGRRGAFVDHWAPPLTTLGRCVRDERGVAAVLTALAAASLLGAAGLAIDVGGWYLLRRNMQAAVDAAATGGRGQPRRQRLRDHGRSGGAERHHAERVRQRRRAARP